MQIQGHAARVTGVVSGLGEATARELAQYSLRVCTVAPGLFSTSLMQTLLAAVQVSLVVSIPFHARLAPR